MFQFLFKRLEETDHKGNKLVWKVVCLFATAILGYGQNLMPVFVVCKGEKYGKRNEACKDDIGCTWFLYNFVYMYFILKAL